MRGRPPMPSHLKALAGNPGKRPINDREPVPPSGVPDPPEWMTGGSLNVWETLAPIAIAMGVLTKADVPSFARYCDMLHRWIEARDFIEEHGTTYPVRDDKGNVKHIRSFPQFMHYRQLDKELRAHEVQFGLTPSARSRIMNSDEGSLERARLAHQATRAEQAKRQGMRLTGG